MLNRNNPCQSESKTFWIATVVPAKLTAFDNIDTLIFYYPPACQIKFKLERKEKCRNVYFSEDCYLVKCFSQVQF